MRMYTREQFKSSKYEKEMYLLVPRYPFFFSFSYLFVLYACENCKLRQLSINRLKAKQEIQQ